MKLPRRHALAMAIASLSSSLAAAADPRSLASDDASADAAAASVVAQAAPVPTPTPVPAAVPAPAAPAATAAAPVRQLDSVQITGKRLDAARNGLSPDTGSSVYRFDQTDIQTLPLGKDTPLNQVLLQAPGVVQDSYGQLHVRGDHSNLQYRIDGVQIPEAISGFGQALETRFADQISLLTGALPAQYGYRTAGVIDIRTAGVGLANGGDVSLLGGSHGHAEGSVEYGGSSGAWNAYVTGSFLRDDQGIENPTSSRTALHDTTRQTKAFAYLSNIIDANSRISLIVGSSNNKFEIPNVPGQTPSYVIDGDPVVDSATLNARQNEKNSFEILTYQASPTDRIDYQLSLFARHTDVAYQPDPVGDLVFDGVAAQIVRKNDARGLQGDLSFRLSDRHTLRAGVFAQQERESTSDRAFVFPADADGNQTSTTPFAIDDSNGLRGVTYGVYLQDEWQPIDKLTINFGSRFDHVSTVTNEKQWSPRLGLTYDVTPTTRIHAGYARYFTPPATEKIDTTSVALFQNTTNALPSDADTSVRSERSNYFDAGISQSLGAGLIVGLDAYYRKVHDLQDEGQFGNALIYSDFNYTEGRIRGIELSTSYRRGGWSAYANVALSQALGKDIATGQFNFAPDELAYIASHWVHLDHDQKLSASGGLSYTHGGTRVGADLIYGSGLRNGFANTDHLPSYVQVNLSGTQTIDSETFGKLDVRVAVINLFDRVYELRDGTGIGVGAPQYGPRRGFLGGLTKYF